VNNRRSSGSAFTSTAFRTTFVTTRTPLVPARNEGSKSHIPKFRKNNIFRARAGQIENSHPEKPK